MDNIVKVYEQDEVQVIGETIEDNYINYEQEILKTCCEQEEIEKLKGDKQCQNK